MIQDLFGDDSLSDYTRFIKRKTKHTKPKLFLYSWTYNGTRFI